MGSASDEALRSGGAYTIGWVFMRGPPVWRPLLWLLIGTLWRAVYLSFIIHTQTETAGKAKRLSNTRALSSLFTVAACYLDSAHPRSIGPTRYNFNSTPLHSKKKNTSWDVGSPVSHKHAQFANALEGNNAANHSLCRRLLTITHTHYTQPHRNPGPTAKPLVDHRRKINTPVQLKPQDTISCSAVFSLLSLTLCVCVCVW